MTEEPTGAEQESDKQGTRKCPDCGHYTHADGPDCFFCSSKPKQEPKQIHERQRIDALAKQLGKQMSPGQPDMLICPECSEGEFKQPLSSMGDFEDVFFCPHCDMHGRIVIDQLPYPKRTTEAQAPKQDEDLKGKFTAQMLQYVLCRLLEDVDGLTVKGEFFENMPVDMGFEAQYDEVNDIWRFFVRSPRKRTAIYKPNRKVITNG